MNRIGIYAGDILVADRFIKTKHGDTVMAVVDCSFTVKTLALKSRVRLSGRQRRYYVSRIRTRHMQGVLKRMVYPFR